MATTSSSNNNQNALQAANSEGETTSVATGSGVFRARAGGVTGAVFVVLAAGGAALMV